MLSGTKTSVEHLVPKSEELLSQTQRQERAISHIHNDLKEKTSAIMQELSQVERELKGSNLEEPKMSRLQRVKQQEAPAPPIAMPLVASVVAQDNNQRPSVVFPSVENKPIVANSTFTYQYGKNKLGVEVFDSHKSDLISCLKSFRANNQDLYSCFIFLRYFLGLFLCRFIPQRSPEKRHLLPTNRRNSVLVPQSLL